MFYRFDSRQRFALNVLVEAILSTATDSPLPGDAGAHRCTQDLVRAINWDLGPPGAPGDSSPLESLMQLVQADLRTSASVRTTARVVSNYAVISDEEPGLRIQRMLEFYRRRYAQATAAAEGNSLEVGAGRDL